MGKHDKSIRLCGFAIDKIYLYRYMEVIRRALKIAKVELCVKAQFLFVWVFFLL